MEAVHAMALSTGLVVLLIFGLCFLLQGRLPGTEAASALLWWASFLWALVAAAAALKLFFNSLPVWSGEKFPLGATSVTEAGCYTLGAFTLAVLLFGIGQIIRSLGEVAHYAMITEGNTDGTERLLVGELFREWLRSRDCEPQELRDHLEKELRGDGVFRRSTLSE